MNETLAVIRRASAMLVVIGLSAACSSCADSSTVQKNYEVKEADNSTINKNEEVKGSAVVGNDEVRGLARDYDIDVTSPLKPFSVNTSYGSIEGEPPNEKRLADYVHLFAPEFRLFPAAFIKRSRLKHIVLCQNLSFAHRRRRGIPHYSGDTLYFEVGGFASDTVMRTGLHHELFHMIDFRNGGLLRRALVVIEPAGIQIR